jgi:hypothetical protein
MDPMVPTIKITVPLRIFLTLLLISALLDLVITAKLEIGLLFTGLPL